MGYIDPAARVRGPYGDSKPLAAALTLGFGLSVSPTPYAATFTVTTLADSGPGSLRDAIGLANAASGADTINFTVVGTITLASQITISDDLTISGPGAANLTITPTSPARALSINGVIPPTVTISGLTFQGANANGSGGAIGKTNGSLTIQASVFTNNQTIGTFAGGGAVYSHLGNLTIQSSTFSGNTGAGGGALYHGSGAGSLTVQNSTFSNNTARRAGGAMYATSGNVTIQNSTFSGNQASRAGGALYARGNLAIQNSTFSGNATTSDGGAVYLSYASTFAISNSTLTGNSATGEGGAIYSYNATIDLASTIVANNSDSGGTRNIFGTNTIVNATNSLIDNVSGITFGTNTANITGQNPLLGALANNGGPTQTHALLAGSPAIDRGSNPLAFAFDQRGSPFVRTSGAQTDIGAFEVQGGAPPPPPPRQPAEIPTLTQWGTVVLSLLLGAWALVTGFGRRRRPGGS